MTNKTEMICIACPVGCRLTVIEEKGQYLVEGALCKRGETYGVKELTNPTRIVTSTVVIEGATLTRIPVRTAEAIPKSLIRACMHEINQVRLTAPVSMGDVVIKNVLNTGVDVILSRSMKKK